jgi:hypothetical protein
MDIGNNNFKKALYLLVGVALVVQLTGCGWLIYPERRGQTSGRIDVGVAILDGVGLLCFLVPGVIAYAVDFATGTIYLPGTVRHDVKPALHDTGADLKAAGRDVAEDLKTTGQQAAEDLRKAGRNAADAIRTTVQGNTVEP